MEKPLLEQPIEALLAAMAAGRLDAAELVERALGAIASRDAGLGAFVSVFEAEARAAAAEADRARGAGARLGPLHGIPVALKDLADVAGWPTGFGSRAYAAGAAAADAEIVRRLRAAGAVLVGKTHLVEFAFGSWGTNYSLGTPRNPRDPGTPRVAGGSSSGSAVAVAAGMVPVAIGSDTGGSVRIPAALCGLVGLKTTVGLLPMAGIAPLSRTLDTLGPLTRCVDDAARVHGALLGAEPPSAVAEPERLRVGAVTIEQLGPLDAAVRNAYEDARERLRRAGCRVSRFAFPLTPEEMQAASGRIMAFEAYQALSQLIDDPDAPLDPHVRARIAAGREIDAAAHRETLARRDQQRAAFAAAFEDLDLLLLPTVPRVAAPIAEVDESTIPLSRLTRAANYLELCALTLPAPTGGLPVGLQLVARGGDEAGLLAGGRLLERLLADG